MKRTMVECNIEPAKLSVIEREKYEKERSLFNLKNTKLISCVFKGKEDGESPLKESKSIIVEKCEFDLRYPLWHVTNGDIISSKFSENSRAPLWYSRNIKFLDSSSDAPKIFRECNEVIAQNSTIKSEELFWKCHNVEVVDCKVEGFYAFFECNNLKLNHIEFDGKYSLQYSNNVEIIESNFNTKDALWHCNNIVVRDSNIKGEYIGWYSKNMTFINCTIESHQPFCYAKNIKLINCKMPNSDLAFENTTAKVSLIGQIDSIKNPRKLILKGDAKKIINELAPYKVNIKIKK